MGNQRLDGLLGARYGLDPGFSPNLAITPDGAEVWVTHKGSGRTSVIDARRLQLLTVLDTGPVTNHVNFVAKTGWDLCICDGWPDEQDARVPHQRRQPGQGRRDAFKRVLVAPA
jgi:hypothetical protein